MSSSMRSKTIGSMFLIAGCCTGAGMLGMPVLSGPYGFIPTVAMFIIGYAYMVASGFFLTDLLVEEKQEGVTHTHLLSLTESLLGKKGRALTWILFGFLFYAVLTAYTIGSAKLLKDLIEYWLELNFHLSMPFYAGISALLTGLTIINGVRSIDYVNRICFFCLIGIYSLIVGIASSAVDVEKVGRSFWSLSLLTTLPVIVFSFGYHNLIPSLLSYLDYHQKNVKMAIFGGTCISLCIYLIWEIVIFGVVPFSTPDEWFHCINSGEMITDIAKRSIENRQLTAMMELFAFFAIVTSYVTVGMSMVDFLRDAIPKGLFTVETGNSPIFFVSLSLIPPLIIGIFFPSIFLEALNYSGGVIAMILFGILPAVCRIIKPSSLLHSKRERIREKSYILFLLVGAIVIIGIEITQKIGT